MSEKHLRRYLPSLVGAGVLVLAACTTAASPSPTPAPAPTATAGATATVAATATESPAAAITITVNVATGTAGDYLTGESGLTLYVKGDDSTASTTCTGDCLTTWPPLTLDEGAQVVAGAGVSGTLSTFTRPEGTTHVTYNGKPLYYFAGDTAAGQTNGQGIADWTVAAP